ncbi:reverse transcriptase domain-containing protein [Tanacetum coccineum]
MKSLGASSVVTPSSVRLSASNSGPLFRRGRGGGSVVFVPSTVWGGVVKVARCRPSALVIVAVGWVVPRGGPIAVKIRSCGVLTLPEACLEICLEAWSLCFFACGVRWVKCPCFVILDFGSVLSVVILETDAVLPQSEIKLQEPWILFTDGSSCVDGSGAGLILTNPEGMEFTYALHFEFTATNNEAEYEALITGLRIAARMGVRNLEANVDSRLVANHVLGEYVAKEDNMIRYLDKTKSLIQGFDRFTIRQVPRGDNKKVDALSSDASDYSAGLCVTRGFMTGFMQYALRPRSELTPITSPWPFHKWGIDIAGPFPVAAGGLKFLIVAIDYFTKWIEAKAVATITGNQVKRFVWDNIVGHFGYLENSYRTMGIIFVINVKDCKSKSRRRINAVLVDIKAGGLEELLTLSCGTHGSQQSKFDRGTLLSPLVYGTEWKPSLLPIRNANSSYRGEFEESHYRQATSLCIDANEASYLFRTKTPGRGSHRNCRDQCGKDPTRLRKALVRWHTRCVYNGGGELHPLVEYLQSKKCYL